MTQVDSGDNTHQIPIEGFELAEGNYHRLWLDLCKFASPNGRILPPLYSQVTHTAMCEWCLSWLAEMAEEYNSFHVYELDGLVQDLYDHATEGPPPSMSMVASILNTSVFDYEDGSSCEYHASKEVKYCALGTIKRFCFSISDSMAQVYSLNLTPRHLPERPENKGHYTILPSDAFALDRRPMWDPPSRQRTTSQPRGAAYNPPPSYGRDQWNGVTAASTSEGNFPARDIRLHAQPSHSASSSSVPETQALRKPTTPGFVAQLSGAVVAGLGRGRGRGTLGLTPEQMKSLTATTQPQSVGGLQQRMAGMTVHTQPSGRETSD
ncbi:MAEL [Branchiostoma lanceolatum]|uniref:MAEL protein n=1 Tax=Branchiostoma lanceolatum TaxID=7740 RepID=A0A8K0EUL4_BRALA|nr:MAEL [Branchiostoma lanceolatum]